MRILFLCSSVEPGRDGVGDYSRALAGECERLGHACSIVALHERRLAASQKEAGSIPILRLPASLPWREREEQSIEFRGAMDPDFISLQFVPYGFQDKGIPWRASSALRAIIAVSPLHVMFHELWIGANTGAPWQQRIIGMIQRAAILRLLRALRPMAVSTSNATYVAMLAREGITAELLPLFGNIPINPQPRTEWLYERCAAEEIALTAETHAEWWVCGFFATLDAHWPPEPLFSQLHRAAEASGRRVLLASIGRQGAGGERLWERFAASYKAQFAFLRLGEQPPERVSDFLQWIDLGVATAPWELAGKSGSTAAMLEHGLPVVANRDDWHWRGVSAVRVAETEALRPLDAEWEKKLVTGLPRPELGPTLPRIAEAFLSSLESRRGRP